MKMTTKFALALTAAVLAMPVAQAHADTVPGWYAGLGAGIDFQQNTGNDTAGAPSFRFHDGYDVLGDAGYAWSNGFRAEGEVFHSNATVRRADGSLGNTDLFANGLYDINLGSWFVPYVGGGIGVAFVDADNIGPVGTAQVNDSSVKLAYQGIVGAAAQLSKEWEVTADYRYIASLDPKFTKATTLHSDNGSHNVILGVRYNFGAPAAPAVVATAPKMASHAAAKPAVAQVPQTFQVFFDFNKSDLTPEAKSIIASASEEYKRGGYVRIAVTGHTDTKGTTPYNKALSNRRAAAVKAEFASLGIDANVVSTAGVGKNGQLVPTNDQVREAQNRRAEIVLKK